MNKVLSLVFATVLSTALPVSALDLGATGSASGTVRTNGAEVGVESETRLESSSNASESNTESAAETEVGAGSDDESTVIIRSDLLDDTSVSVTSSAEVDTKTELNAYAKGVVKANADVRDVVLSETEVAVSHRAHARFLGLIPINVFARAHVASDGTVTVKYPWYAFAAQKKAAIESKVKTAVKSSIPSVSAEARAQAKLSSQAQAQVLEKTVAAMKAEFEADAAAKAQVN